MPDRATFNPPPRSDDRWPRVVLHVDMDAFFASVEQRDFPELRGKPVLVGGGRGGEGKRGVVTTASYEARVFGCRSAMPMAQARRLCPQAIVRPVRMAAYEQASQQVMGVLQECSPDTQAVSIDEAFLDVTTVRHLLGDGDAIARRIRRTIRERLNLPASVGVSFNKFLAKVASDQAKPDGLAVIPPETAADILAPMSVGVIFGVGPKALAAFARMGIRTIADLRAADERTLTARFGPHALAWQDLAWGRDERPVHDGHDRKSIGKERTFGNDISDLRALRGELMSQVEACALRLRQSGLKSRRVCVKLRTPPYQTFSRSITLDHATDATSDLWAGASRLLDEFFKGRRVSLRLLGVSLQELEDVAQLELFAPEPRTSRKLDTAADAVRAKLGDGAIVRGASLQRRKRST